VTALKLCDVRAGMLVRLPDGRVGRLKGLTRNTRTATVLVGTRHVRAAEAELELVGPEEGAR
jgi:hypothetical protein